MKQATSVRLSKISQILLGSMEKWYGSRTAAIEAAIAGWYIIMCAIQEGGYYAVGKEIRWLKISLDELAEQAEPGRRAEFERPAANEGGSETTADNLAGD